MKHRFSFSILSVLVLFSLVLSNSVLAADTPPTNPEGKATLVATVNIQNAEIVSQKGNVFEISFEMSNRQIIQNGVKYGVKLVSKVKGNQFLADEKVYDESLYLPENTIIRKNITYVAPETLDGNYSLLVFAGNSSGFSFGISFVKDITLASPAKGLEIVTDSCYLKVEGDKKNTHYGLLQNVDIKESENLRLTCNTINHTKDTLSLTPTYETRNHSSFGDVANTTGGDAMPIKFAPSKSESFSVLLPKAVTPQIYNLKVSLVGTSSSNAVSVQYIVRGITASIKNLSFDKDYYSRGDKALLTLLWNSSSNQDKFLRSDNLYTSTPLISVDGVITNDNGGKCAQKFTQNLSNGFKIEMPVSITAKCLNPHVSLTLKDDKGATLDQKDFSVTTIIPPQQTLPSTNKILLAILIVIIIIGLSMYMKKKNTKTILPALILLIGVASMLSFHIVSADTYWAGSSGNIQVDVGLDNGLTYVQNAPFSVTGSIFSPTLNTVDMRVVAAGIFGQILSISSINGGSIFNTISVSGATANTGTNIPALFSTGVEEEDPIPPGGYIGSVFATGPHMHGATYIKKVVYTPEVVGGNIHPQFTVRVKKFGQLVDPYQNTSNPAPEDSADEIYVIPQGFANTPMPQIVSCTSNCGIPLNGNNYSVVSSVSVSNVNKIIPLPYHVCKYDDAPGVGRYFSPARWNGSSIQDEPCGVSYPDADVVR